MSDKVLNGAVRRSILDKGFGFIESDGGQQYFFHRTSVLKIAFEDLKEGDRVTFTEAPNATKGPRANDVTKA